MVIFLPTQEKLGSEVVFNGCEKRRASRGNSSGFEMVKKLSATIRKLQCYCLFLRRPPIGEDFVRGPCLPKRRPGQFERWPLHLHAPSQGRISFATKEFASPCFPIILITRFFKLWVRPFQTASFASSVQIRP